MSLSRPVITVFEHQSLQVGHQYNGVLFTLSHWKSLVRMQAARSLPYYSPTHNGIKLSHYVGVLKTPQLTLEILPKADAHSHPSAGVWRRFLVDMLAECRYLRVYTQHQAVASQASATLLDIFLLDFLKEVAVLCQLGLIKQYCPVVKNARSLKGRLLVAAHIRHNSIHRERSFIQYQEHTLDHPMHRLLKRVLRLIPNLSSHTVVRRQAQRLLPYFNEVSDRSAPSREVPFKNQRQTAPYRTAVEAARQILASDFANLYHSNTHQGFALLFDMNLLFEEFVYRRLQKISHSAGFTLQRQTSRSLWGETKVRPDIVVRLPGEQGTVVIDTKWKVLARPRPSAADLHQLYVYTQLFEARRGILLYPDVHHLPPQRLPFEGPHRTSAEVGFVRITDEKRGRLNPELDASLLHLLR